MNLSTVAIFKNMSNNTNNFIFVEGEMLVRLQKVILEIAKDVIELCEKYEINYSLSGGTALGAIRHNGFIPWDDDIDINIMGYHKELFITKAKENFNDKYWIHTYATPEYGLTLSRVRLKNSICKTREDIENTECGFFIDIFFIENVPDNVLLRKIHGTLSLCIGFLLSCRNFYKNRELMNSIIKDNKNVKFIFKIKICIGYLISFMPVNKLAILTNNIYSICKNNKSKYVSIPSGRKHYFGELYLRSDMEETISSKFEDYVWKIPKGYDKYFNALYGKDYMVPHRPEQREHHILLEVKFPNE